MKQRQYSIPNSRFLILNSLFLFIFLCFPFSILGASPFTDNGNGTVTDAATGLLWQKCSAGQSGTACGTGAAGTYAWQGALSYCTSLNLAGRTWRLPSVNELKTLVDRTKASGATIDTSAFPATLPGFYWTSTTYAPSVSYAWFVYFGYGNVSHGLKSGSYAVRCVAAP